MSKTVESAFDSFLVALTPSAYESDAAKRHRESIYECLDRNFGVVRFFRTGSFGNATSVSAYSDVDYFAWLELKSISYSQRQNSAYVLALVCDALDNQFPRTGVFINAPAVVVPFGTLTSETTEIVPAEYERQRPDGKYLFRIANGAGGWLVSSPEVHNDYVQRVDKRLGGRVRPLVRFLKAWNFYNSVGISSFYLEMFTVQYASEQNSIIYDIDLAFCLGRLSRSSLCPLDDPERISLQITPGLGPNHLPGALRSLQSAAASANAAFKARESGDIRSAFDHWDQVFNGRYPLYTL